MGGLLKAPKPVVMAPPPAETTAAVVADTTARTEAAAEDAAQAARLRAVERARRGLAGTIATSARGVLAPAPAFAGRKNLLGE